MKYLSRTTLAVLLVGLFAVIGTSPAQAQASQEYWDNAHPLEYYLALPGMPQPAQTVQVAQVQTPQKNWDNAHPLEYNLALPGIPRPAQTVQVTQVQTPEELGQCPSAGILPGASRGSSAGRSSAGSAGANAPEELGQCPSAGILPGAARCAPDRARYGHREEQGRLQKLLVETGTVSKREDA